MGASYSERLLWADSKASSWWLCGGNGLLELPGRTPRVARCFVFVPHRRPRYSSKCAMTLPYVGFAFNVKWLSTPTLPSVFKAVAAEASTEGHAWAKKDKLLGVLKLEFLRIESVEA